MEAASLYSVAGLLYLTAPESKGNKQGAPVLYKGKEEKAVVLGMSEYHTCLSLNTHLPQCTHLVHYAHLPVSPHHLPISLILFAYLTKAS